MIGKGWVQGRDKFITTVSRKVIWDHEEAPDIFIYDEKGLLTHRDINISKLESGYEIDIKLLNWNELAILNIN